MKGLQVPTMLKISPSVLKSQPVPQPFLPKSLIYSLQGIDKQQNPIAPTRLAREKIKSK